MSRSVFKGGVSRSVFKGGVSRAVFDRRCIKDVFKGCVRATVNVGVKRVIHDSATEVQGWFTEERSK